MGNQHSGSFKLVIEKKYNKPVKQVLQSFYDKGMKTTEIAEMLSFNERTVHNYAKKFGMAKDRKTGVKAKTNLDPFWEGFYQTELNQFNVLSRRW